MITTVNPDDSVPAFNHNAWTICSLLFAWLCYPFIQAWLKRNEPPSWVILLAACGMYSFELTISYLSMDRRWPGGMMYWAERFPVVVILQFSVGVCFAHLLRRKHFLAWPHWAQVGDFTMLVALFVLFYVDNPRGALNPCRCLSEWFFIQGMTPFFALYLYATSCNILTKTPQGYFSQLLTHNVMVGLGDFSFQVYLWQGPMANVTCGFLLLLDVEGACLKGPAFPGTTFGFFLLFLYLFSGWFSFKVEAPFIRWLTRITELKSPAAKIPSK
jgi:peptidoglycan/LPS O-acetylase OafA/YrhL